MSSSSLGTYRIQGNSGPTGPTGPIGPTGGTGNTGPTGPTGNFGLYIVSSSAFTSGITLTLSDGSLFQVLGNFRGITTNEVPDIQSAVSSSGNIVSLLSSSSGGILQFRGISAFGSLFLTDDKNNILINSNVAATPSELDIAGLTSNSLVYLKTNTQISSTTVGVSFDNNNYNGTLTYDNLGNKLSRLNPSYKTKYIGPVQKDEEPIYINCDVAGVFYLNTPIGIAGITGSFRSNEVISITLIPEDENIWHFPENVYFEQGENYLTCGKSVVNLTSTDQGNTWLATVAARGFDINKETCDISNTLGSCCYQTVFSESTTFGSTVCIDYTTREVCDSYFGTFNPLVSCDKACGITGICCTSGKCIENVSPTECAAFNGSFYGGITCGAYENDPTSTNFGNRLCPNPCEEDGNVGCCVEGNGLGVNLTRLLCEEYFGGIAVQNPQTKDYECCEQGVGVGPCCTESDCVELNKIDCGLIGGVYMGETFRCEEVNCDCIVPVIGSCCLEDGSCQDDISQIECQNLLNGNFSLLRCDERNCSFGACCDGSNCTDTTVENCQEGTFYPGDSCSYIECDPVACCFSTGQCADMSRLNCLESGGTPFEGNCQGQSCPIIDDPGPGNQFGFCCVNGQCVQSLQSECSGLFSSESCASLNCDPRGPSGPDDPEEDGGDGWPPMGPDGPGGGGGNGGGGVNGTNCDSTGRCCCLEFSYCEVKLENNQWRTTKKNVKRQVCTTAGSPPVNCNAFSFPSCSETKEKFRKIAQCCAARRFNCNNQDEVCEDVDVGNYCDQVSDRDLFNYLRKFKCISVDFDESSQSQRSTVFCGVADPALCSFDGTCVDCCDDTTSTELDGTFDCQNTSIPLPGKDADRGFEIAYRSCINGNCSHGQYSPCDPQCARVVDPCCRYECEDMGATNCPDCVIQTGCGTSPLTSLFYAKFNINNQDMCLPVICEDCSEYQACES